MKQTQSLLKLGEEYVRIHLKFCLSSSLYYISKFKKILPLLCAYISIIVGKVQLSFIGEQIENVHG